MTTNNTTPIVEKTKFDTAIDLTAACIPYRVVFHGRDSYTIARKWLNDPQVGYLFEMMRDNVVTIEQYVMDPYSGRHYFVNREGLRREEVDKFVEWAWYIENRLLGRADGWSDESVFAVYGRQLKWEIDSIWESRSYRKMDIREWVYECVLFACSRCTDTGEVPIDETALIELGIEKWYPELWRMIVTCGVRDDGDYADKYLFEILEAIGVDCSIYRV